MPFRNLGERIVGACRKISVEPFIFFVMFGYNVRLISMQSLLHERACRVSLALPDSVCDELDKHEYDLEQTQSVTFGNNLFNGVVSISTLPAILIAIFLGPWSDRYSRKYPMLLACTGILVDNLLQTVITAIPDASPFWYLGSCVFSGLSGGIVVVLSCTYSYMSDVTDERSRQTRYAALEFFSMMATPVGTSIGGKLYSLHGYLAVMILSACSMAAAFLYLIFLVPETKPKNPDVSGKQMFQDILRIDNLKESYQTCVKKRPGNLRLQIWLLILISCTLRIVNLGSLSIGFSYVRNTFKWGVERYSYTTTFFSLLNCFATIVLVPLLSRRLLVHEAAVGLIGVLSLLSKMVLLSVTVYSGIIFYAWFGGCLYACGGIAVRSRLSKLVSRTELGKVFSLLAMCESPTPVMGTVIMTQIYHATVYVYPGLAYAVAALILIPAAAIFTWMMHFPSMSFSQYQEMEDNKDMKELRDVSANVF